MPSVEAVAEEQIVAHGRVADIARQLSGLRTSFLMEMLRLVSFAFAGALGTLVNLSFVWIFSHQHMLPYIFYVSIATEMSTLTNFGFNDRVTFRSLSRNGHSWLSRCFRFHGAV